MNNIIINHNILEHDPDSYYYGFENPVITLSRNRFEDSGTWKVWLALPKVPDYMGNDLYMKIDHRIFSNKGRVLRLLYRTEKEFNEEMTKFACLRGNPIYELLKFYDFHPSMSMFTSDEAFDFKIVVRATCLLLRLKRTKQFDDENTYKYPISRNDKPLDVRILEGMLNHEFDDLTFFSELGSENPLIIRGNTTKSAKSAYPIIN